VKGVESPHIGAEKSAAMENEMHENELHNDRPIGSLEQDQFGFGPVAKQLADVVLSAANQDGFVIGVEGCWGAGKSSLLNLAIGFLEDTASNKRPIIIRFDPWLISNRDALVQSLFDQFDSELNRAKLTRLGPVFGSPEIAEKAAKSIQKFARNLRAYSGLARIGASVLPGFSPIVDSVLNITDRIGSGPDRPTLHDQKDAVRRALAELRVRVVVVIDEIDRLEPAEAIEVLRLVRAVADFPNVIYVLAFDRDVLSQFIVTALGVGKGDEFLEKMIQASFSVPMPEEFDLRNALRDIIRDTIRDVVRNGTIKGDAPSDRTENVIQHEGHRRLKTPRDVMRISNSFKLHWSAVAGEVDAADMLWLQLVRTKNDLLYRWIERYCKAMWPCLTGDASMDEDEKGSFLIELESILKSEGRLSGIRAYLWRDILPGFSCGVSHVATEKDPPIGRDVDRSQVEKFSREKRLASPYHGNYYFGLSSPKGGLSDHEYGAVVDRLTGDSTSAAQELERLLSVTRPQGGTLADVVLDRVHLEGNMLVIGKMRHLLVALSNFADEFAMVGKRDFRDKPAAWRLSRALLKLHLQKLDRPNREALVQEIFANGKALGWLTDIFRSETFSHGLYGDRKQPEDEWVLNEREFEYARNVLLDRYRRADRQQLLSVPELSDVLFAWRQSGDEVGPRNWFRANTVSDENLLEVLSLMRTNRYSSNGRERVLTNDNIAPFADVEPLISRVRSIVTSASDRSRLAMDAREIMNSFVAVRDF
jgi:predicted KAP-like P-loop ATPase